MTKIDTNKIEGYVSMTPEQKLTALEGSEYEDNSTELEKQKSALSKADSEIAERKRKHNALLSKEEEKEQEDANKLAQMKRELAGLRRGRTVSEYKAKFVAQGYDEVLAEETAKALVDGDSAKVFASRSRFPEKYAEKAKADAIKKTPKSGADVGSGSSAEDAAGYSKEIEETQRDGDITIAAYYIRLKAQTEAEAKGE